MLDAQITDYLKKMVYLVKPIGEETLIGIVPEKSEYGVTVMFPFICEDRNLLEFCSNAADRRFDFTTLSLSFIKKPKDSTIDRYFDEVIENHPQEFKQFILQLVFSIVDSTTDKTVH